ncbi:MAG: DUF1638 domain-containing protein [Fimbriimonadaceae bacterium]|nr:DUF1638 domain-containing protein [Fimbriimonadaceae bacterium]
MAADSERTRVTVLACGVFEGELQHLAAEGCEFQTVLLDAGLHSTPDKLRRTLQEQIDAADPATCDLLVLLYGLCGRATVGLTAREVPLLLPRTHDCVALFLGDQQTWRQQFRSCPGTLWLTAGWCEKDAHPDRQRLDAARHAWTAQDHPQFEQWRGQYGEGNAHLIVEFLQSWRQHYQRVAYINNGIGEITAYRESAQELAAAVGWRYEELPGSLDYLTGAVQGSTDSNLFLLVPPGHRIVGTHDARLVAAVPTGAGFVAPAADELAGRQVIGEAAAGAAAGLGIGVDAGGTFTDGVLLNLATGEVLAKAKTPTTHHDLAAAVEDAVRRLQPPAGAVRQVAISTTLATNAIVEGRGAKVGLLLLPWNPASLHDIRHQPTRLVPGRLNIDGEEVDPVDPVVVAATVRELLAEGVEAFAVSGYAGTHNPVQELAVKAAVAAVCDHPVVCGHELSSKLDFIRRAHTAVLNARLLPTIGDLMDAVEGSLRRLGIQAPVFVVRGDGSLIEMRAARERPIDTLLSGPAASACGARFLTGCDNLVAVDIGGTTTDIAIVHDGQVGVCEEGPTVGPWRTAVAAVDILTSGLGGDSQVRLTEGGLQLAIGPGRVTPLSFLAQRYESVADELAEVAARVGDEIVPALRIDFLELVAVRPGLQLSDREAALVDLLERGPASLQMVADVTGALALQTVPTGRLEGLGVVRRASFTPTDALHLLDRFDGFHRGAAESAARVLAAQARRAPLHFAHWVHQQFVRDLAYQIVRRELSVDLGDPAAEPGSLLNKVIQSMLQPTDAAPFRLRFEERRPLVGIGAPAGEFLPPAGLLLGARVEVPEHAEVANAIGAVTGRVQVRAAVHIRPDPGGHFLLLSALGRGEYAELRDAQEAARDLLVDHLRERAAAFGTAEQAVRIDFVQRTGRLSDGSDQLLEVRVEGLLEGRPQVA